MESIPVFDFKNQSPSCVDEHLSQLGFMQVRNYGINNDLLAEVFKASRQFFKGDLKTKLKCVYQSAEENFGYQGLKQENLDPSAPADLKETFTMRNIVAQPPNIERWPSKNFRDLMCAFYTNALEASFNLMRAIEESLQLPRDYFVTTHKGQNITLRLLYYPAQAQQKPEPGQLGAGAHSDYGFMTLLFQDDVGGLQVLGRHQKWLDVHPQKNTTIINSGDLLERWTNGHYPSTLHRVNIKNAQKERLSIAFFLDPDSDTWVEPIASCIKNNNIRYSATTAGKHIQEKLDASHKGRYK